MFSLLCGSFRARLFLGRLGGEEELRGFERVRQGQAARAVVRAAAALEAVQNVVLLHVLEVALLEVLIHVQGLELHRANGETFAAVDAGRVLDGAVLFLGEEQDARGTLDVDCLQIGGDQTHHRAAEDDLLRLLDEAAALLDDVAERSAEAALRVDGRGHGAAGIGGSDDNDGRNITISGNAEVIAIGGGGGAGIGGGSACGDGSYITIEGNAKVTAKGGDYAAGIGGGESCDGSNITITGSAEVTATGGGMGAGIGGGAWCTGSENITVSGDAQVKAQGGVETNNPATGAAIGDGAQYNSDIPGREETPNTDALNEGWIAAYAPGTENMDTAVPNSLTYKDDNGYLTTSSNAVPFTKQKPTCTEDGYRAGFTVGNTQVGGETLPATGHNVPNGYTPQNDATCTTLGTMKGYCTNCQTTVTIPDPNSEYAPHSFTNYISNPDATYDHDGTKTARCDFCDATDTIPDPGSKLVWATAPLYRVVDQDGKALACKAERKDGVLTITAEADFAALTGTLGGIRTLKAQGIDTIVFVTNGATSTFALSDLLAQGGDGYTLTHDGAAVTFTMTDGADVSKILQ